MIKILLVFGTRPEAIKMASLVHEFKLFPNIFQTKVCVTAQHRQMLDQVMDLFDLKADYDLDIMKENQDLFDITADILLGMKEVLKDFDPDYMFVHGDTTTTLTTSLAGYYKKIKVCHVEAGLRTGNIYSPWPEEINRKFAGQIATYHFAPTEWSKNNLLSENIDSKRILVSGNTVIDSLFYIINKLKTEKALKSSIIDRIESLFPFKSGERLILVTGHRRENFGDGLLNICQALKTVCLKNPDVRVVYPVHLNPNVRETVFDVLGCTNNIHLIDPLPYIDFVYLMSIAYLIITDSGGIQEEAPSLGVPVLVVRETTERPEAISAGTVKLVGTDKNKICTICQQLLFDETEYQKMVQVANPYGDGKASKRIVAFIKGLSNE